ncbi:MULTISPECIES: phage replisome organizer N-terminal domain-containing protein [unclassified Veillonella]|uniref:phage replisome organizer N-terminal domain-containing protein n=1 Tax=unclassified Veillonella TaxID=2630086 RepID=UPI000F8C6095|nr:MULTISPECIES: phage replisome organizer N-terminal domain-containing protein [unclassified Veillonella]
MEQKTSFPVLGEGYYKELEQQKNELNKQAQMLLAEEEQGGKPVEVTTNDNPVEETATPKKKKKGDNWYFLKVKKKQLYERPINYVVSQENGYHYFFVYMKLLAEALEGKSLVIVELYEGQELHEAIAEMICEDNEVCKKAIEVLRKARLINVGEVDEEYVQCIEMLEFNDFVGEDAVAERVRRHRQRKKEETIQ